LIQRTLAYALLASALIVSACGLIYELVAGALASYLVGDTVTQFSTVIGTYLFAMGVGAWLAQHVRRDLLGAFVRVELLVGLLGGFSTLILHGVFAAGHAFLPSLYSLVFVIGALVGIEIPLLLRILRDTVRFEQLVSRVLSLDYLGALAACLLFPLWFVPRFGLMKTSLFFGLVNVAVAAATLALLADRRRTLWLATMACVALLAGGWLGADRMTHYLDRQMYAEPVVYHEQTPYQRIVVTSGRSGTSLHLNEHLQFNSLDEYRYHEALVHPVMRAAPSAERALVLGGGDGMAVRELLRYPRLRSITLVDLDPAVTRLFGEHPQLASLNGGALRDPRVRVVNADAWRWLEANAEAFPASTAPTSWTSRGSPRPPCGCASRAAAPRARQWPRAAAPT
jgi:spermidine synthase